MYGVLSLRSPLGAGYHDGFTIPAGAIDLLITEEPVNYNVFLGELPRVGQYPVRLRNHPVCNTISVK